MAKVLAADDDELLLGVVRDWLTAENHQIEAVDSGFKCWEKLQSESYDLVILDWDLPEITGIELLRRFRQDGGTTPVLMLTGRRDVDDKAPGLDMGADDYLTKPFQPKELSARV